MLCERCKARSGQLFEIFQGGYHPLSICGTCIVGEYVPVFRPSRQRWCFGEVKTFRRSTNATAKCSSGKFEVAFGVPESEREWVDLASKPFEEYVSSHHRKVSSARALLMGSSPEPPSINKQTAEPCLGDNDDTPIPLKRQLFRGCPHTPIRTSVHRALPFDDPGMYRHYGYAPFMSESRHNNDVGIAATTQSSPSRHWTIDEDRLLLQATLSCSAPLKWSKIAEHVPSRTGKQCRERYFNHLQPTLNHSEWSPVEDARLYYLHSSMGAKWAAIASLLPGRTNNNVKNRFHQIRRRVEKDAAALDPKLLATASSTKIQVMERLTNYFASEESPTSSVVKLLVDSLRQKTRLEGFPHGFRFDLVSCCSGNDDEDDICCSRCGLMVPSRQTGDKRCTRTGWCASCVSAPPYLCSDILRIAHTTKERSWNNTN